MPIKRYRLDELYNIAYETNRKDKQMQMYSEPPEFGYIVFALFIILCLSIGADYIPHKIECSQTAKALNYNSKYTYFTGCVLTKPNGKKVLLKQLRDYGE